MKKICLQCRKMVETEVLEREETYKIKGEDVKVNSRIPVCVECGAELWDDEMSNETIKEAYRVYRVRHDLLTPEEIHAIRDQYGLSQANFAKILGFGDKTVTRYENGSLQDEANNSLLFLCRNPANFRALLEKNGHKIPTSEKYKALSHCEQILYQSDYVYLPPSIPYRMNADLNREPATILEYRARVA